MLHLINTLFQEEDGATMVEYGLLVALIAMVAFAAVAALGINVNTLYNTVSGSV